MSALASATRDESPTLESDWEDAREAIAQYREDTGEANKKALAEKIATIMTKGSEQLASVKAESIDVLTIGEPNPLEVDFTYSVSGGPAQEGTLVCRRSSGLIYLIY